MSKLILSDIVPLHPLAAMDQIFILPDIRPSDVQAIFHISSFACLFQYDSIEWKVQHFYESCKSLDYIESDREKPLTKIVKNLGGWGVLRTFNFYNWDPHRYV